MKKHIVLSLVLVSSFASASERQEPQEVETIESNGHCYDWIMQLLSHRMYGLVQGHINKGESIDKNDFLEAKEEFSTELVLLLNDPVCGEIFIEYIPTDCTQKQDCSTCDEDESSLDVILDHRLHDIINPINLISPKKRIKMLKKYKKQRTLELLKKQINN